MIRTKTTYSKEVFNDFAKHNIKTSGSMKVIYACAVIILACALVMAVMGSYTEGIIYGILGLIFAGYSPLMKAIINANNKRNIGTTDEYEFYDDKFYVAAYDKNGVEMASSTIMYSRLYKVKRNFGYGYIYVNKQVAYIIQRENFEEKGDFDIVIDKIQKAIKHSKIKGTTPAVFGSQNVTPAKEEGEQYLGEPVPPPETEEDILARKALEAQKAAEEAAKAEAEAEKENAENEENAETVEDGAIEEETTETEETLDAQSEEVETENIETETVEEIADEVNEEDPAVVEAEKALTEADEVIANAVELDETTDEAVVEETVTEDDNDDDDTDASEQQPVDEVVNNFIVNEVNDLDLETEAENNEEQSNQINPLENEQPEFVEDNYDELPEPVDPYAQYQPQPVVENLDNQENAETVYTEETVETQPVEQAEPVVIAPVAQDVAEEVEEDEEDDDDEKPARARKKRATTKKKTALTEKRGRGRPRKEESAKDKKPKRGRGRPKKEEKDKKPKRGRGRPPKADKKAVGEKRGRGRPRKEETTKKKPVKKAVKVVKEEPVAQTQDVVTPVYQQQETPVVTVVNSNVQPEIQSAEPVEIFAEETSFAQVAKPVYNEQPEVVEEETFAEPVVEETPNTVSEEDYADAQALLREYGEAPAEDATTEEVEDVQPVIEEESFETEDTLETPVIEEDTLPEEDEIPEAPVRFTETIAEDPDYQPVQPQKAQFFEEANSDTTFSIDTSDENGDDDSSVNIGSMPDDI